MDLSIIIPFLNERQVLPLLRERLTSLADAPPHWEIVFVSDGSTDGSVDLIEQWADEDPRVKLVVLTRNFGHQAAISAGLGYANGDHVAIMDADLQDPPEVMLELYDRAKAPGVDIVYSVRHQRTGALPKRFFYQAF